MEGLRPFDLLPDELLHHIMRRCGPTDLAKCEIVCRRWRSCVSSGCDSAWLLKTAELWASTGWNHNVSRVCRLSERLRTVPVPAMRRALTGYDTAGLIEKSEWMCLLLIELLWGRAVCSLSHTGWVPPNWAIHIDDCKAAYLFARKEIARKVPLECELWRQKWDLTYVQHPLEQFEIEFFDNGEMTASSHPGARFRWRLHGGRSHPDHPPGLQVENFPLHTLARKADGLWMMCNLHVVIEQRRPPLDDLPLFDIVN